jgi:hypothetical protein
LHTHPAAPALFLSTVEAFAHGGRMACAHGILLARRDQALKRKEARRVECPCRTVPSFSVPPRADTRRPNPCRTLAAEEPGRWQKAQHDQGRAPTSTERSRTGTEDDFGDDALAIQSMRVS